MQTHLAKFVVFGVSLLGHCFGSGASSCSHSARQY